MSSDIWSVAVEAPLPQALTYKAPADMHALQRGQRVLVPLGKRKTLGVVLGHGSSAPQTFELKSITEVDLNHPQLPEHFLKWLEWVSEYYLYPIGMVTSLAYPALKKSEKKRKSNKAPVVPTMESTTPPIMTEEQKAVYDSISKNSDFNVHLLFGVTGSGKTEVYLKLLEDVLASGKRGLVLVPEISLTPQLVQRFAARFGDKIAVLHSQLTDRERTDQWWDIIERRKSILIGARSALFCPVEDLGLIIVDEEHEPSFKQDEKLKYHGRDCAVMLGRFSNCPVILGSATPSLESWKNTVDGKYQLQRMEKRVEDRNLPNIQIVDMRKKEGEAKPKTDLPDWISEELYTQIEKTLDRKEQVALFLNRRGMANLLVCPACGFTHECPNCDISLTLHGRSHLVCHYCDYQETKKDICPDCKEGEMTSLGLGTEHLESEIQKLFPLARVARADRDEISTREQLEELIFKMERGEIDILVGTQMIAKGLDFPKLTLVGLVLADIGFNLPDFRSTERSFQLITQVSGRAGRHISRDDEPGKVIIQTLNPDHPSLTFAKANDYVAFATQELQIRDQLKYPPIGRLASFRIQGTQLAKVQNTARIMAERARQLKAKFAQYSEIEVLGPAEAPIAKLRGQYRYHLLIKTLNSKQLVTFAKQLIGDEDWVPAGGRVIVDIDPLHLL